MVTVVMALEEEVVKIIRLACMVRKVAEWVQRKSIFVMI